MYALLMYRDPATWNALSAEQRAAVAGEHDAFRRSVPELVLTESFAHPAETTTIRARGDATIAVTGPYVDTPAHLCGYYSSTVSRATARSSWPAGCQTPASPPSRSASSPTPVTHSCPYRARRADR
jgi:hypothetical protein